MRSPDRPPLRFASVALTSVALIVLLTGPAAVLCWGADETPEEGRAEARRLALKGDIEQALEVGIASYRASPEKGVASIRLVQDLRRLLGRGAGKKPEQQEALKASSELDRRGFSARLLAPDEAAHALEALLTDEKANPLFGLDLARAYIALDQQAKAESLLSAYLKVGPEDTEAHVLMGLSLASRGKQSGARSSFEQALKSVPGLASAVVPLAASLGASRKDKQARAVLQEARTLYPENAVLLLGLADDQVRVGEYEAAIRGLNTALGLQGSLLLVHERLALAHRKRKQIKMADTHAGSALQLDAASVTALRTLGWVKQKRKDYKGALEAYEKVLALKPKWPQIHVDIAFVKTMSEDRIGAGKALRQALKLDKNHLNAHLRMGIYCYLGDDDRGARKNLAFVLKEDKENVPANRYMGYLLLREGKPKNALKHFKKICELDPQDVDAARMMGKALMGMGKLTPAVEAFRGAIARDDKNALAYFDLGKGLRAQAKYEDALLAFRQAISLDGKLASPHLYVAEITDEVKGDEDGALPYYKSYLALGGYDKTGTVKKRIKQIEDK